MPALPLFSRKECPFFGSPLHPSPCLPQIVGRGSREVLVRIGRRAHSQSRVFPPHTPASVVDLDGCSFGSHLNLHCFWWLEISFLLSQTFPIQSYLYFKAQSKSCILQNRLPGCFSLCLFHFPISLNPFSSI